MFFLISYSAIKCVVDYVSQCPGNICSIKVKRKGVVKIVTMETKHLLYDNWMYHKLQSDQIRKQIRSNEKIIRFASLLDVNSVQIDYIHYKLDCLYFELHRRAFTNCRIQLYAYHKVKSWLINVRPFNRCICCMPEYYEFKYDCQRISAGELQPSDVISNILSTGALSGGRSFFLKQNVPEYRKEEEAAAAALLLFAENAVHECRLAVAAITLEKPIAEAQAAAYTTINKPSSELKGAEQPWSMSSFNNGEDRCLIAISNVKIVGNSSTPSQPTPGPSGLGAVRRSTSEDSGFKAFRAKKFGNRHKRFRKSMTLNRSDDENPSCSYEPLKEDYSSPFPVDGKVPKPSWHFGFNFSKEDKSGSKKKDS